MVVADQMERSVNHESRQLVVEGAAASARLTLRGLDSDDDVAEQLSAKLRPLPFEQREGENVGGPLLAPVALVQLGDLTVGHQVEGKF